MLNIMLVSKLGEQFFFLLLVLNVGANEKEVVPVQYVKHCKYSDNSNSTTTLPGY